MSSSATHQFSKTPQSAIQLLAGLGVDGDAHCGQTVKHRSRVAKDPLQPNLRQVHLIHAEFFDDVGAAGFTVAPGELGENITTRGLDLLSLPTGTRLQLGESAVIQLTGLRNPCAQIEHFQPGLLRQMLGRATDGTLIRKTGVMAIVLTGGEVRPGDTISVALPPEPQVALECV